MSDINLLPDQDRKREEVEQKQKAQEKDRAEIKLSNPIIKKEEKKKSDVYASTGFWGEVKEEVKPVKAEATKPQKKVVAKEEKRPKKK